MPEILFHALNPRRAQTLDRTGRPEVPELKEAMDYSTPVPSDEIDLAKEVCCDQLNEQPASRGFVELAHLIMDEENLTMPDDAEEALRLYIDLVYHIENI